MQCAARGEEHQLILSLSIYMQPSVGMQFG